MEKVRREDFDTAQKVREAQAMQRAFGDEAARTFLERRHIPHELAQRVLTAPLGQRRY
jgi:hypothetical protein